MKYHHGTLFASALAALCLVASFATAEGRGGEADRADSGLMVFEAGDTQPAATGPGGLDPAVTFHRDPATGIVLVVVLPAEVQPVADPAVSLMRVGQVRH